MGPVPETDLTAETDDLAIEPGDLPGVRGALLRYRVMAWIVGTLLVVLVCIGLPLKYIWDNGIVVTWTGVPHGWLYMILLITAYDLSRRVGWSIKWVLAIMAAGTVPFLSFVAEHIATKDVAAKIAAAEAVLTTDASIADPAQPTTDV